MTTEKIIAIGDIHGCYNTMIKILKDERLNINFQKDKIIFLGDYIDRGNFPLKTLLALKDLQTKHPENVICLKGNHEDMCCKYYFQGKPMWSYNGNELSRSQIDSYENMDEILSWIKNLPLRYETDKYCFCHSGNWSLSPDNHYGLTSCLWDREWIYYGSNNNCPKNKIMVCGHTPHRQPTYYGKDICIDTGVCYPDNGGGQLTAFLIMPDGTQTTVSVATEKEDLRQ